MKNLTLGRIAEVCGGTYFGKEEERNLEASPGRVMQTVALIERHPEIDK